VSHPNRISIRSAVFAQRSVVSDRLAQHTTRKSLAIGHVVQSMWSKMKACCVAKATRSRDMRVVCNGQLPLYKAAVHVSGSVSQ